ncbi:MAG TPA: argininosuccinate lyase [Candidatus Methylomirabilis sp.]|nr:argininosuccinate lyase [Candidatus Methylomirabilis sp.]
MAKAKKVWSGRFGVGTDTQVEAYTASIPFDWRLYPYDVQGSIAYARALMKAGVLTGVEAGRIIRGLEEIKKELDERRLDPDPAHEDIHMYIEGRLTEKIGEVGGKLHTGRSRNEQVALDLRLYLRAETDEIVREIRALQEALVEQAEAHLDVIIPGYTHLQRAQPILWAHQLLAYVEMLRRDAARLRDSLQRVTVMPLGSGALAGTAYAIDRVALAEELGFPEVSRNSIDAVSDRDFALEFLAAASITMMHLSRLCEEVILWASAEFAFVDIPEAFATGSSLMPQKKNPDVAELARGKAGRVFGDLISLLTAMKGLPLSYNRDLQEDKERVFDAVDTLRGTLQVLAPLVRGLRVNADRMRQATKEGFLNATDAADYLVSKALPFRRAHEVVGKIVRYCIEHKKRLEELSVHELRRYSRLFDKDFHNFIAIEASLKRRGVVGGTAPEQVRKAILTARAELKKEAGKK